MCKKNLQRGFLASVKDFSLSFFLQLKSRGWLKNISLLSIEISSPLHYRYSFLCVKENILTLLSTIWIWCRNNWLLLYLAINDTIKINTNYCTLCCLFFTKRLLYKHKSRIRGEWVRSQKKRSQQWLRRWYVVLHSKSIAHTEVSQKEWIILQWVAWRELQIYSRFHLKFLYLYVLVYGLNGPSCLFCLSSKTTIHNRGMINKMVERHHLSLTQSFWIPSADAAYSGSFAYTTLLPYTPINIFFYWEVPSERDRDTILSWNEMLEPPEEILSLERRHQKMFFLYLSSCHIFLLKPQLLASASSNCFQKGGQEHPKRGCVMKIWWYALQL